ncbi:MAG: hypothetical protein COA62_09085 [Rhodobiaceae bacterium]|nr:MAG: hypothetical protein COA62_09085 [Rhodobiaceae bacterium]
MNIKSAWTTPARSQLLRRVLLGNAAFSTTTGAICLLDGAALTQMFNMPDPLLLPGLGIQLLLFAAFIVWIATRQNVSLALAWTIIALDFGWVAGSAALLPFVSDILTTSGITAMIVIAAGVSAFAVGQIAGVRQLQHS